MVELGSNQAHDAIIFELSILKFHLTKIEMERQKKCKE